MQKLDFHFLTHDTIIGTARISGGTVPFKAKGITLTVDGLPVFHICRLQIPPRFQVLCRLSDTDKQVHTVIEQYINSKLGDILPRYGPLPRIIKQLNRFRRGEGKPHSLSGAYLKSGLAMMFYTPAAALSSDSGGRWISPQLDLSEGHLVLWSGKNCLFPDTVSEAVQIISHFEDCFLLACKGMQRVKKQCGFAVGWTLGLWCEEHQRGTPPQIVFDLLSYDTKARIQCRSVKEDAWVDPHHPTGAWLADELQTHYPYKGTLDHVVEQLTYHYCPQFHKSQ
jgi:hypothetical protein